jgi:hypothetical protein
VHPAEPADTAFRAWFDLKASMTFDDLQASRVEIVLR